MLTSIKGFYDNGEITLTEKPPSVVKAEVIVTFLPFEKVKKTKPKRKLGGFEGKVELPKNFNEPLEDLKDYM